MRQLKKLISILTLSLFMATTIIPVYAAGTENNKKTILTLKEIQDLAVQNSRFNKILDLNDQNVHRNQRIVKNSKDKITGTIGKMPMQAQSLGSQSAGLAAQIKELEEKKKDASDEEKKIIDQQLSILRAQQAAAGKAASDVSGTVSSLRSTKKDLKRQEEQLEDTKEDTEKAQADYKEEVKQIAALLTFQAIKLQDNINVLEKTYTFNEKLTNVEKVKKELGMAIDTDIEKQSVNTSDIGKQLKFLKEQYKIVKRNINDLIGREINTPLTIVKYTVPESVIPAPIYAGVKEEVLENSYDLYKADRDIENLEDEYDDTDGDHAEQVVKNNIKLKELEKEQKLLDVQNNLKNKLASYNDKAKAFQNAILTFRAAEKTYNWDKHRHELGTISDLELTGSELNYLKALNDKVAAGFDYQLARNEFLYFKDGISLNNYQALKGQFSMPAGA